jgi:hypothetical protein
VVAGTLTILLVILGGQSEPPSTTTSALLALITILSQGGAAWAFSGIGRADPVHAKRSAERVAKLALQIQSLEDASQQAFELSLSKDELRIAMGRITASASILKDSAFASYRDWEAFHAAVPPIGEGATSNVR